MISISGVFAVTFSVVFAYVADVTTTEDRSKAYGLVSATFAASLVNAISHFTVNQKKFIGTPNNFVLLSQNRSFLQHLENICAKFIAIL